MDKKTSIIGFVRYSINFFKKKVDVFELKYFEYRFEIFKNITLKSFQNQTDMDFQLWILHSPSMPENLKARFDKLEQENSFLHNCYINKEELEDFFSNSTDYLKFENGISVNFRIDNDDAVPCNYIERLREYCKLDFIGHVISISHIYVLQRVKKNLFLLEDREYISNSIGLAYVTNSSDYKTIMQLGNHSTIQNENPLIVLNGQGGLQTINGVNMLNTIGKSNNIVALTLQNVNKKLTNSGFYLFDLSCLNVIEMNGI